MNTALSGASINSNKRVKKKATKLVEIYFARKGLFDVLPTLQGYKKLFLPHPPPPPPFNVVPLFKLPAENNKHSNFEWRGGEGRGVDSFVP